MKLNARYSLQYTEYSTEYEVEGKGDRMLLISLSYRIQ